MNIPFYKQIAIRFYVFFKKYRKILFIIGMLFIVSTLYFVYWSNEKVEKEAAAYIYHNLNTIPECQVGLVLGTSRFLTNGQYNPYFTYRIQAAKALYFSGKIHYLLLSGDNRFFSYNEPREMRKELIRMGIPDSVIFLDFAGFRTLDSVVRSNKVFKLKRITIISQEFHNLRAIYIARHHDIEAIGYNAQDPPDDFGWKVQVREYFARASMMLDLYILNRNPYFLGNESLPEGAYK